MKLPKELQDQIRARLSDMKRRETRLTVARIEIWNGKVFVTMEDDPPIFMSGMERRLISDPNGLWAKNGLTRWAAGGFMPVYNQGGEQFFVFSVRGDGAPSYAGHANASTGISGDPDEWHNPMGLAIREGCEEVAIIINGRIVVYNLLDLNVEQVPQEMMMNIAHGQVLRLQKAGMSFSTGVHYADTHIAQTPANVQWEIHCGEHITKHVGILNQDDRTNGADFLVIGEARLPEGQLVIADAETDKGGNLLHRDVLKIPLKSIQHDWLPGCCNRIMRVWGAQSLWQRGQCQQIDHLRKYPVTPVTATMLCVTMGWDDLSKPV